MTSLMALWLPILLSAVIVFVVSSIIHMVSPWHKGDYPRLANEDQFRAAVRPLAIPPGDYMVPRPASRAEMKSPAFAEKVNQGPNVIFTVLPNGQWMTGKTFVQWFVYSVVVSLFAAYIASRALPPGTEYLRVYQLTGASAFMGYALALWQVSIWYRRSWVTTFKLTVDGLVYALFTAGTFGWLWPK